MLELLIFVLMGEGLDIVSEGVDMSRGLYNRR